MICRCAYVDSVVNRTPVPDPQTVRLTIEPYRAGSSQILVATSACSGFRQEILINQEKEFWRIPLQFKFLEPLNFTKNHRASTARAAHFSSASDVRLAKKLVIEICQNHPSVVESPPTIVTFEEFGDNRLKFTASTFLKGFDSHGLRLTTSTFPSTTRSRQPESKSRSHNATFTSAPPAPNSKPQSATQ